MTNTELKNSTALTTVGDGFSGYNDRVEGDDRPQQQGLIRGSSVKFGSTAEYETRDGEVLDRDVKLVVVEVIRAVVKWPIAKGPPEETIIVPPGQPFPDVEAMNEAIPKAQWRQGPAGPQGPYQTQQYLVMLDPTTMEHFTFVTSAIGGFIAIRDLVDKTKAMRRYRGPVSPIITLGDALMKTRFGERRRPHFNIVDWVRMGGSEEPAQAALPAPVVQAEPVKAEPVKAAKPATRRTKSKSFLVGDSVAPLTTAEELNNEVSF